MENSNSDIESGEALKIKTEWDGQDFGEALEKSAVLLGTEKDGSPDKIDLSGSVYGQISDELVSQTTDIELGTYGLYKAGKVVMSDEIQTGYHDHIGIKVSRNRLETIAVAMHTHPELHQFPPGPEDLVPLLTKIREGGLLSDFVLTKDTRYLLIPTIDTPRMDQNDLKEWYFGEMENLNNLIDKETSGSQDAMVRQEASVRIQMQRLGEICEEKNILLYISTGDNNYTKENARAMQKLVEKN